MHRLRVVRLLFLACLFLPISTAFVCRTRPTSLLGYYVAETSIEDTSVRNRLYGKTRRTDSSFATITSSLGLFFRSKQVPPSHERKLIPEQAYADIASVNVTLPFSVPFTGGQLDNPSEETGSEETIVVRLMKQEDVKQIVDLCVKEYGEQDLAAPIRMPTDGKSLSSLLDRLTFRPYVDLVMRMKITQQESLQQQEMACDHVVLVCTVNKSGDSGDGICETVIGMVDVSLQPVIPDRNPPAFPLPLWMKQLLGKLKGVELQAWVTNLLVAPGHRRRGYAKLLLAAADGMARRWNCRSVHLHCDASITTAQRLYKSVGYRELEESSTTPEFSWMGPATFTSSVFIVEGVPLLYLQKKLESNQST